MSSESMIGCSKGLVGSSESMIGHSGGLVWSSESRITLSGGMVAGRVCYKEPVMVL